MRIGFTDFSNLPFDATTVDRAPLGGTESAVCYLSRAMARLGHEVWLIGNGGEAGARDGVACFNLKDMGQFPRGLLDVVVCTGVPKDPTTLRQYLASRGRLL